MSTDPTAERVHAVSISAEFRHILDTLPAVVWCAAPDGSIAFLNRRGLEYTGFSQDQVAGWNWRDTTILHTDDMEALVDAWPAIVASRREGEIQARMRRFDGTYRRFLFRVAPLFDEKGELTAWWGVDVEIDTRTRAEDQGRHALTQVQAVKDHFQLVVDTIPGLEDRKRAEALLAGERRLLEMMARGDALSLILEAVCELVEQSALGSLCSILLVDPTGTRLHHGAAPSLPSSYNDAIHGRAIDPEAGPCGMAAFVKEQVVAADITCDTQWGACEWGALAAGHGLRACWSTPITSSDSAILGTFALYWRHPGGPTSEHQTLIERLTHLAAVAIEHWQTAAALQKNEAHLARAQRLSATGSFSYVAATDDLTLSEETYRICGFDTAVKITAGAMRDRIHPEDLPLFLDMLRSSRREFRFDCRVLLPGGSVRYLQVIADARRDDCNQLVECVGAVRDVTDRKRSEDALNRVRSDLAHVARVATLGEMTASIAHEINQPLGAIVNNASAALRWLSADNMDAARVSMALVVEDGHRASEILHRIRAMVQKSPPHKQWVDLNDAVREVLTLVGSQAAKHGVSIESLLPDGIPPVRADRVQVQQVVLNLILNAIEAMSDTPAGLRRITVASMRANATTVHVSVRDRGAGFSPEQSERLFEAFYSTKPDGLGLGLAISRGIVQAHHGRLWATANTDGGATFQFAMPVAVVGS